ncbi:MAG: AsmA family protein [Desulfurivibrionaceae bacterium]
MSKSLKIILYAVGGFCALIIGIAVAVMYLVDLNSYKPDLEAAATRALGMEVRVGGRLGIAFFPGLLVTLEDVHLHSRGTDFASAKEARLGIDLLPLLLTQVRINKIALKKPMVSIERDRDGRFNFEKPKATERRIFGLDLSEVSLAALTLAYADKKSGLAFEAGDCTLDLRRLQLASGKTADLLKNLSLTAEIACGEVRTKDFVAASDLQVSLAGRDGVFELKPVALRVFGGQGSGSVRADFTGAIPQYQVRFALAKFNVDDFFKTLSPEKVAKGTMNFSANLLIQGKTAKRPTWSADGEATLRGVDLILENMDLDQMLARIESSQNFNLVDVGALFFTGPLGLVVTKGYNFASIFRGSGGSSEIRRLVSDWKVEHGVAQALDVAMATDENRIALQGGLDFVNERFNDVTMAVVDADGCAIVEQQIHGPFQEPVVEKPNILVSLTGPALNLLQEGIEILPGYECEVFYRGTVAPPQ